MKTKSTTGKQIAQLAVLFALTMGLSACGGDDNDTPVAAPPSAGTPPASPTPPATGTPAPPAAGTPAPPAAGTPAPPAAGTPAPPSAGTPAPPPAAGTPAPPAAGTPAPPAAGTPAPPAAGTPAPPATAWQTPQLLENSDDFNVRSRNLVAVNSRGDAIALWEQSDGTPDGSTFKVFSRRYQPATGWQTAVAVPGLTLSSSTAAAQGKVFLDDAGVATWIRPNMETRRNTVATGWSAAFSPPNLRFTQELTSAVMDASGNISVLRSGSDVENSSLPVGGQWGTWTRLDNGGSSVAQRAAVALSTNGSSLAVWRESNPGDNNYSMKAARFTTAGGWGAPVSIETLFTNVDADNNPAVAIDAQGNGIAMWLQNRTVHYNIYRADTGWQGAVEVTGQTSSVGSARIQLAMTPDGRAVAVWSGSPLATLSSMQYNPATGWTAPVVVDTYNINRTLQMDNNGQAVLVYSPNLVATLNFDLVSRRLTLGGQWSAASLIESGAGGVGNDPDFAMNSSGQGVVVWSQNDVANTGARVSLWSAVLR